jgi:uncharacterized membrane protein
MDTGPMPGDGIPDQYWIMGSIYYNPNDPSLMVQKRIGIGFTFNFGHPAGKAIGIGLILLILVSIALPIIAIIAGH